MCIDGEFRFFSRRYLENEGIEYLRTYLHLPSEIVPSTLKRAARTEQAARARPSATPRMGDSKTGADRSAYRRAPTDGIDKKGDVGAGTGDVEFVSVLMLLNTLCTLSAAENHAIYLTNSFVCFFFTAWWIRPWLTTSINN